jgi:hypothetical protein
VKKNRHNNNSMNRDIQDELEGLGNLPVRRAMPYEVPADYFSKIEDRVKAAMNETGTVPQGVATPYEVPVGYFEALPARILALVGNAGKRRGMVITLRSIRWAAAALLIMMIGAGSYQLLDRPQVATQEANWLSNVDEAAVEEYLDEEAGVTEVAPQDGLEKIDAGAEDIVSYLDETGWGEDGY